MDQKLTHGKPKFPYKLDAHDWKILRFLLKHSSYGTPLIDPKKDVIVCRELVTTTTSVKKARRQHQQDAVARHNQVFYRLQVADKQEEPGYREYTYIDLESKDKGTSKNFKRKKTLDISSKRVHKNYTVSARARMANLYHSGLIELGSGGHTELSGHQADTKKDAAEKAQRPLYSMRPFEVSLSETAITLLLATHSKLFHVLAD